LLQHLLDRELRDVEKPQQVRRRQGIKIVGSVVRKRLFANDSRVIHQNIDGSELPDGRFDRFESGFLFAYISVDQNQAGGGRQRLTDASRCRDNVVAFLQEALNQTGTDTPRCTRDDRSFFFRHSTSPSPKLGSVTQSQ
jgi:hypothetical protein